LLHKKTDDKVSNNLSSVSNISVKEY
jgi:hypothetical protein